eukprot:10173483-Alexandrium_andersonii.AAC.1
MTTTSPMARPCPQSKYTPCRAQLAKARHATRTQATPSTPHARRQPNAQHATRSFGFKFVKKTPRTHYPWTTHRPTKPTRRPSTHSPP